MSSELKFSLVNAIRSKDLDAFLLDFEKEDLDSDSRGYGSLLHVAVSRDAKEIAEFLIENGADVNRKGATWRAPAITYAADRGMLAFVNILLQHGATIDVSHSLRNPLMRAAEGGHAEVVVRLLETDIDPHLTYRIPSGKLINALTEAESSGCETTIKSLKDRGCKHPVEGEDIPVWEPPAEQMLDPQVLEQYNAIVSYMEERFGRADTNGMHEIFPQIEGMSVAINIIQPSDEHPYLVLFTNGMSDLPMKVPAGHEDWQYGELMIQLPKEWVHPRESKGDPKWLWPIQWLRQMAYFPHLNESWLGRPATIAASDDPPVPLGPGTEQSCLFLVPDLGVFEQPLERPDGKRVHFYTMVPLFTAERDFELKYGMEKFLRKFSANEVPLYVDVDRPSFA